MTETTIPIAVIGGSGIHELPGELVATHRLSTPWGSPSAPIQERREGTVTVFFLPRHGTGHTIPPHQINYRANIDALHRLGVRRILAVNSVGSLKQELPPGTFVLPDQFVDWTRFRPTTFFDGGRVAHVSLADPFCPELSRMAQATGPEVSVPLLTPATYVCVEGPRFSTRAESRLFRTFADVIGMTLVPEVTLARERGICYLCLATVTDYDVWQETPVNAGDVVQVMAQNTSRAIQLLSRLIPRAAQPSTCSCHHAMDSAWI